jgi:hypothetical protein
MILWVSKRPFRLLVLAFYVLALILPVSVQAGLQLSPTAEYQLLKDIAESRCLSNKNDGGQDHAGQDCCILCQAQNLEVPAQDLTQQLDVSHRDDHTSSTDQTTGLELEQSLLPASPRGPPTLL